MIVRFTKGQGRPDTLTCLRDDGSLAWEPSRVGVRHDLIHYAVETTLGFREAFFGLVAGGRDIADFGTRNGRKDVYPNEAVWAESIVGLLQWPAVGGGLPLSDAEFREMLARHGDERGRAAPEITGNQLARMRTLAADLHRRWDRLPEGESLELAFSPRADE